MPEGRRGAILSIMNNGLLFAFELHKARNHDLQRQLEENRLGRDAPPRRKPGAKPLPAAPCCRPAA